MHVLSSICQLPNKLLQSWGMELNGPVISLSVYSAWHASCSFIITHQAPLCLHSRYRICIQRDCKYINKWYSVTHIVRVLAWKGLDCFSESNLPSLVCRKSEQRRKKVTTMKIFHLQSWGKLGHSADRLCCVLYLLLSLPVVIWYVERTACVSSRPSSVCLRERGGGKQKREK